MSKKQMKDAVRISVKEVMKEMEKRERISLSEESRKILKDDEFRQEAYAKVQEWIEEAVQEQLTDLTVEISRQIKELKSLIKKEQKNYSGYQVDVKMLERSEKELKKRISELEEDVNKVKIIFTTIAVSQGVVGTAASFNKVYKKLMKYLQYRKTPSKNGLIQYNSDIEV